MNHSNDRATWLQGNAVPCSLPPKLRLVPPRLVLLGAPGIGKRTQAEQLCAGLGVCHLSTGDVFRSFAAVPETKRTRPMVEALSCLNCGKMAPDASVLELVRDRSACLRCRGGFLLNGFPSTVAQARALDEMLEEENLRLEAVLNYTLPFQSIIDRLSGRRSCPACRAVCHVTNRPPCQAGICDQCGGALIQLPEDAPEAVEARLLAYERTTKPLIQYYLGHGIVRTISAEGTPERVYQRTLAILDN